MKTNIKKHEEKYYHIPKDWYKYIYPGIIIVGLMFTIVFILFLGLNFLNGGSIADFELDLIKLIVYLFIFWFINYIILLVNYVDSKE